MAVRSDAEKQVWDPFVRVAHWTIAVAFVVVYLTEDEAMTVHVWAGYLIGAGPASRRVGFCRVVLCPVQRLHFCAA